MGLTMGQRQAVTKAIATCYLRADKAAKGSILDELCATTGWHRNHARKALGQALRPKVVRPRRASTAADVRAGGGGGAEVVLGGAGCADGQATRPGAGGPCCAFASV